MNDRPRAETDLNRALPVGARIVVVINPSARSAGDRDAVVTLCRLLEKRYRVETVAPSTVEELHLAAKAAAHSADALVVAGGDGTLHRVINAIDGTGVALGLLPLGTGNDFARALRLPFDPAGASANILDGRTRQIDLVAVNGRLFCTVGVIGVAAEATLAFDRLLRPGAWTRPLMRALGGWSYRLAGLNALLKYGSRLDRVTVTTLSPANSSAPADIHGAFVTNTTLLGGGMAVPVASNMADGQLEIACIEAMSKARLYWAFTCLANGWPVPEGLLRIVRTHHAVITSDQPLSFAADGEPICVDTRFDIAVQPGALCVIG
ncbi:MAG: diacylglycerol kinase family protein [Acidobacteriota bacterium]